MLRVVVAVIAAATTVAVEEPCDTVAEAAADDHHPMDGVVVEADHRRDRVTEVKAEVMLALRWTKMDNTSTLFT